MFPSSLLLCTFSFNLPFICLQPLAIVVCKTKVICIVTEIFPNAQVTKHSASSSLDLLDNQAVDSVIIRCVHDGAQGDRAAISSHHQAIGKRCRPATTLSKTCKYVSGILFLPNRVFMSCAKFYLSCSNE